MRPSDLRLSRAQYLQRSTSQNDQRRNMKHQTWVLFIIATVRAQKCTHFLEIGAYPLRQFVSLRSATRRYVIGSNIVKDANDIPAISQGFGTVDAQLSICKAFVKQGRILFIFYLNGASLQSETGSNQF